MCHNTEALPRLLESAVYACAAIAATPRRSSECAVSAGWNRRWGVMLRIHKSVLLRLRLDGVWDRGEQSAGTGIAGLPYGDLQAADLAIKKPPEGGYLRA